MSSVATTTTTSRRQTAQRNIYTNMPTAESENFSSQGFDLDAPLNNEGTLEKISDPKDEAEDLKAQGNVLFQQKQYEHAMDMYSRAIETLVNSSSNDGVDDEDEIVTGMELLGLRDEFEDDQRQKAYRREREEREAQHSTSTSLDNTNQTSTDSTTEDTTNANANKETSTTAEQKKQKQKSTMEPFQAPSNKYSRQLSIYHSNRAAACANLIQAATSKSTSTATPVSVHAAGSNNTSDSSSNPDPLQEEGAHAHTTSFTYNDVIDDCDVALLHNPTYVKALIRRMSAYEKVDRLEDALQDIKLAVELEPKNAQARRHAVRLQKLYDEKMEKMKDETIGKLKDLGNSLLSNFGLSLDNFQTNKGQDGAYSISFNNDKK